MSARGRGRDALVAIALAAILSMGWAITGWSDLRHMVLPDPDDMMRLAQIRDWLGGQAMNDWTQYRMAPPGGVPMHWSRLNDLLPAGIILAATPLWGRGDAELLAILIYPGLLFALCLFLSARIARRLWGPSAAPVGAILGALAYPGTGLFVPGRIDHHALQAIVILVAVAALMRAPRRGTGMAAGVALAFSMMIGLETAP